MNHGRLLLAEHPDHLPKRLQIFKRRNVPLHLYSHVPPSGAAHRIQLRPIRRHRHHHIPHLLQIGNHPYKEAGRLRHSASADDFCHFSFNSFSCNPQKTLIRPSDKLQLSYLQNTGTCFTYSLMYSLASLISDKTIITIIIPIGNAAMILTV